MANSETRSPAGMWAVIALAGTAYFAVVIVAMHYLRPDVDPIGAATSEYAVGDWRYLMTSALVALALGSAALIAVLRIGVSASWQRTTGLVFLVVWTLGLFIAATFPTDVAGSPQTTAGTIHRINGALSFLSLATGIFLVSRGLARDERWRGGSAAQILSYLVLAGFVAGAVTVPTNAPVAGLSQRILITAFVAWFVVVAIQLRAVTLMPNRPGADPGPVSGPERS